MRQVQDAVFGDGWRAGLMSLYAGPGNNLPDDAPEFTRWLS